MIDMQATDQYSYSRYKVMYQPGTPNERMIRTQDALDASDGKVELRFNTELPSADKGDYSVSFDQEKRDDWVVRLENGKPISIVVLWS